VPPDPEPFDAFYRREFPALRVLARALAGDALADDVAQETMLVAYRQWATVADFASPSGWVRCVCARKAISAGRRRQVEQRALRRMALVRGSAAEASDDETFWSLLRRLPARQAQVAALFYALDLSVADVARTLSCAEGTVKVHLSRARTAMGKALDVEER
jgi:RNA polymerase sigma-70 factor, ECF subfamily